MPPIPPIAPEPGAVDEAEAPDMTEPTTPSGTKVSIKCAARDCKFNKAGMCSKPEINVSAGPDVKCESYEPTGGGVKPPAPPAPFMMGGAGPMGA